MSKSVARHRSPLSWRRRATASQKCSGVAGRWSRVSILCQCLTTSGRASSTSRKSAVPWIIHISFVCASEQWSTGSDARRAANESSRFWCISPIVPSSFCARSIRCATRPLLPKRRFALGVATSIASPRIAACTALSDSALAAPAAPRRDGRDGSSCPTSGISLRSATRWHSSWCGMSCGSSRCTPTRKRNLSAGSTTARSASRLLKRSPLRL
mmetsp:Transcript_34034/g.93525  ORF Transcript_34034/g.93525 Transcript_34034/m.93525 type:complete len:213 (+) Transcript_34034:121-759(+)